MRGTIVIKKRSQIGHRIGAEQKGIERYGEILLLIGILRITSNEYVLTDL